jgi:chaperonin GroES
MTIRPLADRILCEVLPREKKSPGGIHIPEGARGRATRAKVLACGRGFIDHKGRLHEPTVKTGDVVVFNAYAVKLVIGGSGGATPHAQPGDQFLICECDIYGIEE